MKEHRADECTSRSSRLKKAQKKLNIIVPDNSADKGIEIDFEYLCSIQNQRDVLMMYHCEINNVQNTALLDTRATRNYISQRYAEKVNLKFRGTAESQCSVRLLNRQVMKILSQCEFKLGLPAWNELIAATVLDLKADFDIIFSMR